MARRSGKTRLTSGNSRFTDHAFALVKVSLLFADMHNDLGRTGGVLIIPPTRWSGLRIDAGCSGVGIHAGRIRGIGVLLATEEDQSDKACTYGLQQTARVHWKGIFMRGSSRHSTLNVDSDQAHGRCVLTPVTRLPAFPVPVKSSSG